MIEILNQAPRLHAEAADCTDDVNEAYFLVHNAMARAMSHRAALPRRQDGRGKVKLCPSR